jgi:Domain of unknown function (DUF1707)
MDRAGWTYPGGDVRVSDADRDRACFELGEAFRAGRLTTDEFGQRSEQALSARTGSELTALLTDLPVDDVIASRAAAAERDRRIQGTRIAIGLSTAGALFFAAGSVAGALSHGPTLQQRRMFEQMAARHGFPAHAWFPNPGFNWPGTIAPAVIAVLLVVLIVFLRRRLNRAKRSPT